MKRNKYYASKCLFVFTLNVASFPRFCSVHVDILRLQIKSISACNKNITRNLNYEKLKILEIFTT